MPSEYLKKYIAKPRLEIESDVRLQLDALDNVVVELLETLLVGSTVKIVSNSEQKWVHFSSQKFLPKTYRFILQHKIKVFCLCSELRKSFSKNFKLWKFVSFTNAVDDDVNSIISIGNNKLEMEIAHEFKPTQKMIRKSIKLLIKSDPADIRAQLCLIIRNWKNILNSQNNKKYAFLIL